MKGGIDSENDHDADPFTGNRNLCIRNFTADRLYTGSSSLEEDSVSRRQFRTDGNADASVWLADLFKFYQVLGGK